MVYLCGNKSKNDMKNMSEEGLSVYHATKELVEQISELPEDQKKEAIKAAIELLEYLKNEEAK